jgi:hypothetical protein
MDQATITKFPATLAFCPACWTTLSSSDTRCRVCGAEIESLSSRPYPRKLLAALDHPIGEVRERAVELLGKVGERDAYDPLIRLATESPDPYLAATALESLARLLMRYPDLPSVDWTQFARPDRPITVRVAAVEIQRREFARLRRAEQEKSLTR